MPKPARVAGMPKASPAAPDSTEPTAIAPKVAT
ncbi:hypothetical protein ROMU108268_20490 [Roseomonas mucosa]